MKFYVTDEVFEKMPNVIFGLVSVYGVDNGKSYPRIEELLTENIKKCENYFDGKVVKETDEVKLYREAFKKLGINPNKFMSSIEALLTRISKKKGFPIINPVVDLGNAVSLNNYLPIGAHDLDSMKDNEFCVKVAEKNDYFRPFGNNENETESVDEGEIVYANKNEVRTRRWIWRQSENGKITEETSNLLFIVDGFLEDKEKVLKARDELASLIQSEFDCPTKIGLIDTNNKEFMTK